MLADLITLFISDELGTMRSSVPTPLSPTYEDQSVHAPQSVQQQDPFLSAAAAAADASPSPTRNRNASPPLGVNPAAAAVSAPGDARDSCGSAASRLLAIANYGPFSPGGLATCTGLAQSDYLDEASGDVGGGVRRAHDGRAASERVSFSGAGPSVTGTSAASGAQSFAAGTAIALSGPHGIAILRSNKPHIPSVVLSHSTHTAGGGAGCGPLAFQPSSDDFGGGSAGAGGSGGRSTMLLATARGPGVLVWDASGRSLSPLLGRLGHDGRHPPAAVVSSAAASGANAAAATTNASATGSVPSSSRPPKPATSSNNSVASSLPTPKPPTAPSANTSAATTPRSSSYDIITSLCWLSAHSPTLVTTSARSASIWDLRCPSISRLRPSTRYELGAGSIDGGFVSCAVAGDGSHEVAILDGSGIVRIYDTRMGGLNPQSKGQYTNSDHPLHAFYAHESGVGISRLPLSTEGRRGWLTWGFDSYDAEGSVKVWREGRQGPDDSSDILIDSDDYWNPRPEVAAAIDAALDASGNDSRHFELTATFGSSSGDLSAARVVPHPYGNAVVTIGTEEDGGWKADYWTLSESPNTSDEDFMITGSVFGAKLEGSFEGGSKCNDALRQVLGGSSSLGYLIQADLAVGPPSVQADHGQSDYSELLLCCLGSSGYLTTHVVSEATPTTKALEASGSSSTLHSSPRKKVDYQRITRTDVDFMNQQSRLYRPNSDPNLHRMNFEDLRDEGPLKISRLDSGQHLEGKGAMQASELSNITSEDAYAYGRSSTLPVEDQDILPEAAVASISRGVEGALFQFELDVAGDAAPSAAMPGEGVPPSAKSPANAADAIAEGNNIESQNVAAGSRTSTVDPFRAMNVPCPRLCGATFGKGGGGLIIFSNGDVRRQWTWFQAEQQSSRDAGKVPISKPDDKGIEKGGDKKSQQYPRMFFDLMRMNSAAKIAQWGVDDADDESGHSDDESSIGSDDSSSSSSASSSDGSEEFESFFLQQTTSTGPEDGYTGDGARRSTSANALTLATTAASRSSLPTAREKNVGSSTSSAFPHTNRFSSKRSSAARKSSSGAGPDTAFVNPATDHLAPVVTFTQSHDFLVMNGQCPELADSMEFGPWGFASDEGMLRSLVSSTALSGSRVSLSSDGWGWIEEPKPKNVFRSSSNERGKCSVLLFFLYYLSCAYLFHSIT